MSELGDIQNDIGSSWRNLQTEWAEVRAVWTDLTAEEFEKRYWFDVEAELPKLLSALENLDEALRQTNAQLED